MGGESAPSNLGYVARQERFHMISLKEILTQYIYIYTLNFKGHEYMLQ